MQNIQYIGDTNSSEKQICSDHFMQLCCKEISVVSNLHIGEVNHHTYQKWDSCQLKHCFRIRNGWKFFLKSYTLYFYFYYTSVHVTTFSGSNFYSRTNYCWSSQANEAMALWIRKKKKSTCGNSHPQSSIHPALKTVKGKKNRIKPHSRYQSDVIKYRKIIITFTMLIEVF